MLISGEHLTSKMSVLLYMYKEHLNSLPIDTLKCDFTKLLRLGLRIGLEITIVKCHSVGFGLPYDCGLCRQLKKQLA